ncbi:hypothetical protein NXX56_13920 [Bacteroides thetaiotaomicron]|nr:hypothetical protein [Bacteroides thetaiotaomicron]
MTSTEENSRFVLEQYALGILNLYGLLPYTEFLKQLTGYLKGSMTKDEIAEGLSNSMLMRQLTFDIEDIYNSVMYVRSPLLLEVEDLEERLYAHRAIKKFEEVYRRRGFVGWNDACVLYFQSAFGSTERIYDEEIRL